VLDQAGVHELPEMDTDSIWVKAEVDGKCGCRHCRTALEEQCEHLAAR